MSGRTGDLRLEDLTKSFGAFTAVDHVDLTIPRGSFFALLGPSGCGKTTTLRMIAGLEQPTSGRILIGDDDVTGSKAYQRDVNTVFQNYALFPHLSVFDNVAFGLRRKRVADWRTRAAEALELVELSHTARQKPAQLSGGMQQRVALARAVVNRPDVLLLDEPLGALDLKLRRQMQIELKRIQQEVGLTFVHVTHDQEEAMTMADTIAVMNGGRLEQVGDPAALYERPATAFVANFLGQSNLLHATVTGRDGDDVRVDVHGVALVVPREQVGDEVTGIWLGVRPEKLRLAGRGDTDRRAPGRNVLPGQVTDVSFTGITTSYLIRTPWDQELTLVQQNDGSARAALGEHVHVSWDPRQGFALDDHEDAHAGEPERVG